jgi:hypothetical protein
MAALKYVLASLCLSAVVTPAHSQVTPGGASPVNLSMLPSCAVATAAEARTSGCALLSELTPLVPPTAALGTCNVLNLHPTKTVSGNIEVLEHLELPTRDWVVWSTAFAGLAPGTVANAEAPVAVLIALNHGQEATIYCRITLIPASALDHVDARQVRTSMSVVDTAGKIVSSGPLH